MIECVGLNGSAAKSYIDDLAKLRCTVFREFPYLYSGDLSYERDYLSHYTESERAFLVIAKFENRIIGVSTCMPMLEADPTFQEPFIKANYDLSKIGYFGESVLLPEFRGHGVGHQFFDLREQWAAQHDFFIRTFCAVQRPDDHPARPKHYRPHDAFWNKRGYQRHDELIAQLVWPEIEMGSESFSDPHVLDYSHSSNQPNSQITEILQIPHQLVFWLNT